MEGSGMLSMVRLRALASLAPRCITVGILHHIHPPVGLQQGRSQLPWARVPSSWEIMLKLQNLLTYFLRHPGDSSFPPQPHPVSRPLVIKPLWLLYMHRAIFLE